MLERWRLANLIARLRPFYRYLWWKRLQCIILWQALKLQQCHLKCRKKTSIYHDQKWSPTKNEHRTSDSFKSKNCQIIIHHIKSFIQVFVQRKFKFLYSLIFLTHFESMNISGSKKELDKNQKFSFYLKITASCVVSYKFNIPCKPNNSNIIKFCLMINLRNHVATWMLTSAQVHMLLVYEPLYCPKLIWLHFRIFDKFKDKLNFWHV